MDLGLHGKVALVAGGSSGLGFAIAAGLLTEGARVSIAARDPERLDDAVRRLSEFGEVHGQPVDVMDESAVNRWVDTVAERFGAIHVVVANAGGPPPGMATEFDLDAYRQAMELNLLSSIGLVQRALPHLKAAGWGRILFVTSSSVRQPIPNLALSNTARAGVVGYAKSLVAALGAGEITVNVLAPGRIRTPRLTQLPGFDETALAAEIPLGRIADPREFATVAVFLASTSASYVTGAVVPVDGGFTRSLL
ncbi:MAG TPA: SDR family oxidoreductase [Micromonosporaceae bacterium]|jgi:3-oxoacyl-[acyl-carrier protein] reductase|nr:SDR family oxidoreductase [Micromonosporaceae bacterium]